MQTEAGSEESFVDELVQAAPEHSSLTAKKLIRPWHKPRKHWIRQHQWKAETARLIDELGLLEKERSLSYMSLPGPDMLDVRAMQELCAEKGVPLRFLGFMKGTEEENTELNISRSEVVALDGVVPTSLVVPDALQSLSEPDSVGFKNFRANAPYDVVNIDLCQSVLQFAPDHDAAYYNALKGVIDMQRSLRAPSEPWILFLTTRANRETIDPEARRRLFDCLLENMRNHADVIECVQDALGLDIAGVQSLRDGATPASGLFEPAFAAAVSKWLLKLVSVGAPVGTVELLESSCMYGVRVPEGMDMLSLGFVFRTQVVAGADVAGLATSPDVGAHVSEPEAACAAIRRVPLMSNVDQVLRSAPGLYETVAQEAAAAMRVARYDPDEYIRRASSWKEAPVVARVV